MAQYARETSVPAERSRQEIEATLVKYGATGFAYGWQESGAIVAFEFKGRRMKFALPMPALGEAERHPRESAADAQQREVRRRWRSLALSIKAKLVTVTDGISTVETEFMGHIVLPNGMTVSEWMHPQLESAYRDGKMPPLLGPGPER